MTCTVFPSFYYYYFLSEKKKIIFISPFIYFLISYSLLLVKMTDPENQLRRRILPTESPLSITVQPIPSAESVNQNGYQNVDLNINREDQGITSKLLSYLNLSFLMKIDTERADNTYVMHEWANKNLSKFQSYKKNMMISIISIIVIFLFYKLLFGSEICTVYGDTMCKISLPNDDIQKYNENYMEYKYSYKYPYSYKTYCEYIKLEDKHSTIYIYDINGTLTYYVFSDDNIHEYKSMMESKEISKEEIKKEMDYFVKIVDYVAYQYYKMKYEINHIEFESDRKNKLDTLCTFDSSHNEYKEWLELNKNATVLFDVSSYELNKQIIHTKLFLMDGLWDVSLNRIANMLKHVSIASKKSCVCSKELGVYKNIIYINSTNNEDIILVNPKAVSKSHESYKVAVKSGDSILSWGYDLFVGGVLAPIWSDIQFLTIHQEDKTMRFTKSDSSCILYCINDSVFSL